MKKLGIIGLLALCITFLSGYGALDTRSNLFSNSPEFNSAVSFSGSVAYHLPVVKRSSDEHSSNHGQQYFETIVEDLDLDFLKKQSASSAILASAFFTPSFGLHFELNERITHFTKPVFTALSGRRYLMLQVFRI